MGLTSGVTRRFGLGAAAAVALAVVFGIAQPRVVRAQSRGKQDGGPKEGIQIHGHWAIDIRQPDGTLVTHTEFENGLLGADLIARVFARSTTIGTWYVALGTVGNGGPPPCPFHAPPFSNAPFLSSDICFIGEQSSVLADAGAIPGLPRSTFSKTALVRAVPTTTNPTTGYTTAGIVVTGSARAANSGAIFMVSTVIGECPSPGQVPTSFPSSQCAADPTGQETFTVLTHKALDYGIDVAAGQTIDVTVTISFS